MAQQSAIRLLHVTNGYGTHKYYANGRRIRQERYNQLFDEAQHRDAMVTVRKDGAWYGYTELRFPQEARA